MINTLSTSYCKIILNKKGSDEYTKISFPLKYGIYSEIETQDAILQFNLNHEIVRAKGKGRDWIQPSEWLKRTIGNDWVYYSTGGYAGVFESIGEYYLPNLPYPTNSLIGGKPFNELPVKRLLSSLEDISRKSLESIKFSNLDSVSGKKNIINFLESALINTPEILQKKADFLFNMSGGRVTVMPPDARHVDYDIIPLIISDGCIYKCKFCRVKSDKPFAVRPLDQIDKQIKQLKEIYGNDITNYNSIFLGDHDGLNAARYFKQGESIEKNDCVIIKAAKSAYKNFEFDKSYMKGANLFMFGSVDSFMSADSNFFESLNSLQYKTYINIGLESADQETLDLIGKPISAEMVEETFIEIQRVNAAFNNIEITANFIMDENLPKGHYPSFLRLVRENIERPKTKGTIYLSPLRINKPSREVLFEFHRLKTLSRLPTFLYIIQRL